MNPSRWIVSRFLLSARSQGLDYPHAIRYALDRSANYLMETFS